MKFESPFKFKLTMSLLCCFTVVFINVAIFAGIAIDAIIKRKISTQLTMTQDNIDVWGQVPGRYDIFVTRNLTLYNISNPDALFTNSGPIQISHTEPILLREKHIVNNSVFSGDGNMVTFNETYTFDIAMPQADFDRIGNSNVTMINLFALGAWDSAAKRFNLTMKAFYTLGSLLTCATADDDVYYEALGLAVYVAYVNRSTFQEVYNRDFLPAGISKDKAQWIYSDILYGWNSNSTVKKWAQAIDRGAESDDAIFLADYFDLSFQQISHLFKGRVSKAVQEGALLVKDAFSCPSTGTKSCDPVYLAAIQIGRQDISLRPPPPIIPFKTLGQKNITIFGMPEFSYFYTDYFLVYISQDPVYQNLQLTQDQSYRLFSFIQEGYVINSNYTLVHPMNMDALIRAGQQFDDTGNIAVFNALKTQFALDNVYIMRVLYEWAKYLATNLASDGLNVMDVPTKTKWAGNALSDNYERLLVHLKPTLQSAITYKYLINNNKNCPVVVANTIMNPDPAKVSNFCGGGWAKPTIDTLYVFCNRPTTSNYQQNQTNYWGFSYFEMNLMCDTENDIVDSMGYILNLTENKLATQYNCNNSYCSMNTLSLMQIVNSTITMNPPQEVDYSPSNSITSWMNDIFPKEFEMKFFMDKKGLQMRMPTLVEAMTTFYWDNIFSPLPPTKALADYYRGDPSFISSRMHFDDPAIFEKYINYITLNVYLGGLTYTGRIKDILFGFTPDIVNKVRNLPPLTGGDPSTPQFLSLNENNTWVFQTRYTGKNNISQVGWYYSTNGNHTVNMLREFWDGVHVKNISYNPWNGEAQYEGGDSNFEPNSKSTTIQYGYITDLYRSFHSTFLKNENKNKQQVPTMKCVASSIDGYDSGTRPENSMFWQYNYTGILNYTNVKRAPVYLSKMMFQEANDSLKNNVRFYDNNNNLMVYNSDMDGYAFIEPRSGVPLDLAVNFQINLDASNDTLLETRPNFLMPAFTLKRSMTLSDNQVS